MLNLEAQIEAVLFWRAEPISVSKLSQILNKKESEITESLMKLEQSLENRGVSLIRKNEEIMLGTNPEASSLIEKLTKEELSRDLGRASLETLTTILYKQPISRAEIDYIRGVNSSFILRHLMVRGLVERIQNPDDARSFLYRPSFDLLQHLGLKKLEDLPDYDVLTKQLEQVTSNQTSLE
ncbi:MAG: SMC-Scp complex subunit ScpB [Patescibacteria group bacterium]